MAFSYAAAPSCCGPWAGPAQPRLCYHGRPFSHDFPSMIETNPILAQIADLKGRVESLRGYL